jgi:hypothetical protein
MCWLYQLSLLSLTNLPANPNDILSFTRFAVAAAAVANPAEKKQLQMVSVGYNNLVEKVSASEVAPDVLAKLAQLVSDLTARNFTSASAIQTVRNWISSPLHRSRNGSCDVDPLRSYLNRMNHYLTITCRRQFVQDLANTVWGQHKEWIKVLKMLIQLAAKK